jgi:transcriptional regulator with XRE-family HTH domain
MAMLRRLLGQALRRERLAQHRTLREVSSAARVSLGYLSEVERGQKEASSELLSSICEALDVRLSNVLREVSDDLAVAEGAVPVSVASNGEAAAAAGESAGSRGAEEREPALEPVPAGAMDLAGAATASLAPGVRPALGIAGGRPPRRGVVVEGVARPAA